MIIYKPFPKIQAMSFDLDDTLYDNWPHIKEAENRLLAFIAEQYPDMSVFSKADWQSFKRQALKADASLYSDMGELRKTSLTIGFSQLGYKKSQLENAVSDCFDYFYYERSNFNVSANVIAVLKNLSSNYPLIAITNGNVNLKQIGIADCFVQTYKANRLHPMKPDPHMFNLTADYLKLPRDRILHVGDNLIKDIWGATKAGYSAAWHACDRPMNLSNEQTKILPNIQINDLQQLNKI